jgi:DNA-binding NarL/FixJ family response regulator
MGTHHGNQANDMPPMVAAATCVTWSSIPVARTTLGGITVMTLFENDAARIPGEQQRDDTGLPVQRIPAESRRRMPFNGSGVRDGPGFKDAVLLADPGRTTRELLSEILAGKGLGQIIAVDSVAGAQEIIERGIVGHLALVSLAFGDNSVPLIQALRRARWRSIVVLAPAPNPEVVVTVMQAGACGVLRGHPLSPIAAPPLQVGELSEREIEVLALVANGESNKQIGARLALSALTVKSHLARISRKLGTGDRAGMVAIALRSGAIR